MNSTLGLSLDRMSRDTNQPEVPLRAIVRKPLKVASIVPALQQSRQDSRVIAPKRLKAVFTVQAPLLNLLVSRAVVQKKLRAVCSGLELQRRARAFLERERIISLVVRS